MCGWMQWCCCWKQHQPRYFCGCWCCVDTTPALIYTCCLSKVTQHPWLKSGSFCCCCRRRCMFLSCTHDVLIVGCDSFRSSFILDTRFSSPSSFFYCTFMFLWSSFIDALPVCVFADSCVSSGAPSFVVNTQALPVLPAHHIFFLILNHPRPSRQVRAWSAPEAVAYYEYKGRLYKNMLQCRTLPSYNI